MFYRLRPRSRRAAVFASGAAGRVRGPASVAIAAAAGGYVVAFAVAVQFIGDLPAVAQESASCLSNEDHWTGRQNNDANEDNSRGTEADILVREQVACQRIDSVYVVSPDVQSRYEFGYFVGYNQCASSDRYLDFFTQPTLFQWSRTSRGEVQCRVWPAKHPSTDYHSFRVSDVNGNTYFGAYYEGVELQPDGINMDFSQGWNALGSERGHADDSKRANYHSLREYHGEHPDGSWSAWEEVSTWDAYTSYPGYRLAAPDGHTGNLVPN